MLKKSIASRSRLGWTLRLALVTAGVAAYLWVLPAAFALSGSSSSSSSSYSYGYGYNGNLVAMCHKGTTIYVSPSAVAGHLHHGDTLGPCP